MVLCKLHLEFVTGAGGYKTNLLLYFSKSDSIISLPVGCRPALNRRGKRKEAPAGGSHFCAQTSFQPGLSTLTWKHPRSAHAGAAARGRLRGSEPYQQRSRAGGSRLSLREPRPAPPESLQRPNYVPTAGKNPRTSSQSRRCFEATSCVSLTAQAVGQVGTAGHHCFLHSEEEASEG